MNDWRASSFQKRSSDVAQPFLFIFFQKFLRSERREDLKNVEGFVLKCRVVIGFGS